MTNGKGAYFSSEIGFFEQTGRAGNRLFRTDWSSWKQAFSNRLVELEIGFFEQTGLGGHS